MLHTNQLSLDSSGDAGAALAGDHVDLAADAELGEVDAGSTEKQVLGRMQALVVGFEIVEVGAGAVDLVGDVVAGAVGEVVGESCRADDGAGGVVGFEAADGAVCGEGGCDGADGGIARVADGFEDESARARRARDRRRRSR